MGDGHAFKGPISEGTVGKLSRSRLRKKTQILDKLLAILVRRDKMLPRLTFSWWRWGSPQLCQPQRIFEEKNASVINFVVEAGES